MSGEPRYKIRALDRALAILRILNQYNGLNSSELSRMAGLPRPTVLRLLLTMSELGYVTRSEADGCFRVCRKVRELSSGFSEEPWLRSVARPFLAETEAAFAWPLAIIRLRHTALVIEALTDHNSKMLVRREAPGAEIPLLTSASGYLFMALAEGEERERLMALAKDSAPVALPHTRMSWAEVEALAADARQNDYAELHLTTHSAISVPVRAGGEVLCALNMRMHARAGVRREQIGSYVPMLKHAASALEERIAA